MTNITFRIPEEEKDKIAKYAEENDLTISQIIRKAIKEYLDKMTKPDKT